SVADDIPQPEHLADALGDLTESLFAVPELVALLPESGLDLLAFADIREQSLDFTRRLVGSEELIGRHVVHVPSDAAAIDDHWMRADDVQDELRRTELAVV